VPVTAALYDAPGGATVAPSGTALNALGAIDMNNLPDAIETLRDRFDVVVLDTGAGVNSATTTAVSAADETVLVSTPRVASVRDTGEDAHHRRAARRRRRRPRAHAGRDRVLSRVRPPRRVPGGPLLCTVHQDASIHESQDAGVPVVERLPDSEAARAYVDGAAALAESRLEADASEEPAPVESETTADDSSSTDESDSDSGLEPTRDEREAEPTPPPKRRWRQTGGRFPGWRHRDRGRT